MPAPTFSSFLRRHLWKIVVIASASAAIYALTLPLVQVPGMGEPLTFMETGKLQGQILRGLVIAAALATLVRLRHPAGILAGIAIGLAGGVACNQYNELQKLKVMNAEMIASGTSMGDMSKMLDIRVCHGAWVLGISLALLLIATFITSPRPARRHNIRVRTNPFIT